MLRQARPQLQLIKKIKRKQKKIRKTKKINWIRIEANGI
jgi:hypothetical protein